MKHSEKIDFIKERWEGPTLNFEGGPGVPPLNFERGPGVSLLNLGVGGWGVPGSTFKLWGGPRSRGLGPTLITWPSTRGSSFFLYDICRFFVCIADCIILYKRFLNISANLTMKIILIDPNLVLPFHNFLDPNYGALPRKQFFDAH